MDHISSIKDIESEGITFTFAYKNAAEYAVLYC
jgi:hypothetical protein